MTKPNLDNIKKRFMFKENKILLEKEVLKTINAKNPRTQFLMTSLVKNIHRFIAETAPTEEELEIAIDFLTRVGQNCDDQRQEFILLADVLGASMLVDLINHQFATGATESTVTGPFHAKALEMNNGDSIATGPEWETGEHTLLYGQVRNLAGEPIAGAKVDFWQTNEDGFYDSQDDNQPSINLRGIFTTDKEGKYLCLTVKPLGYSVPMDGPVGELLRVCERKANRPAHIHVMITAPGYRKLVTHIFVAGDEYIQKDATFGVKDSLIADFVKRADAAKARQYDIQNPFYEVEFDFILDEEPEKSKDQKGY